HDPSLEPEVGKELTTAARNPLAVVNSDRGWRSRSVTAYRGDSWNKPPPYCRLKHRTPECRRRQPHSWSSQTPDRLAIVPAEIPAMRCSSRRSFFRRAKKREPLGLPLLAPPDSVHHLPRRERVRRERRESRARPAARRLT